MNPDGYWISLTLLRIILSCVCSDWKGSVQEKCVLCRWGCRRWYSYLSLVNIKKTQKHKGQKPVETCGFPIVFWILNVNIWPSWKLCFVGMDFFVMHWGCLCFFCLKWRRNLPVLVFAHSKIPWSALLAEYELHFLNQYRIAGFQENLSGKLLFGISTGW